MNAVHEKIEIKRRENIQAKKDYHEYLQELREDFFFACGYCGKKENITKKGFEIDHLIPVSHWKGGKTDYHNLVYSCFTCNRKKADKFPMRPSLMLHNDTIGIIDPASSEYNEHIKRDEKGNIVGATTLGNYVCKHIFAFHLRPMSTIYKLSQYKNKLNTILKSRKFTQEKFIQIIEIQKKIDEFERIIFESKE